MRKIAQQKTKDRAKKAASKTKVRMAPIKPKKSVNNKK
ncbi:hypothetical protein FM112_00010 [Gulosibacter sp. 10]|nr:hypothetical protein FM112_00010 [Gulosibacter sp. 10]